MSTEMKNTTQPIECCICMEDIVTTNCTTTSCNHTFHSDCLMKHALYNGFTCPCCRTTLAEKSPEAKEDDDDATLVSMSEDEYDDEDDDDYDEEMEEQNLDSVRWLFQRANGEELDGDQTEYEQMEDEIRTSEYSDSMVYEEQEEQIRALTDEVMKANIPYEDLLRACIVCQCKDFWNNKPGLKSDHKVESTINSIHTRMMSRPGSNINTQPTQGMNISNTNAQSLMQAMLQQMQSSSRSMNTTVDESITVNNAYDGMHIYQPSVRRRHTSGPMDISELM